MFVKDKTEQMIEKISEIVVGQDEFIRQLLIAFFSGGHVLIEGVPGLGKTLCAKTLAGVLGGDYKRIQFTPDLMPSDITGTMVFDIKESEFYMKKGPVFTNILLADEINRTPPKTQSALLEAMEENFVTIDGQTLPLPKPFFVLATQNPVEYEGTYPLPEAQLDRFMMKVFIKYTEQQWEDFLLKAYEGTFEGAHRKAEDVQPVITPEELAAIRNEIASVRVTDEIIHYITGIVGATRKSVNIILGASPRASISLLLCSRTIAAMNGRDFVTPDDVAEVAIPVLRHRIILKPEAGIDGLNEEAVLRAVIRKVEVPR